MYLLHCLWGINRCIGIFFQICFHPIFQHIANIRQCRSSVFFSKEVLLNFFIKRSLLNLCAVPCSISGRYYKIFIAKFLNKCCINTILAKVGIIADIFFNRNFSCQLAILDIILRLAEILDNCPCSIRILAVTRDCIRISAFTVL